MHEIINTANRKILSRAGLKSVICKAAQKEYLVKETIYAKLRGGGGTRGMNATFTVGGGLPMQA